MNAEQGIPLQKFGVIDGQDVLLYKLRDGEIDVEITNYGCTIVSILTPDKYGNKSNIVAGFNNLSQYQQDHPYFGCIVGRYCNRIAHGKFLIDDELYQLPLNDGTNHLHGGVSGFNRKVWKTDEIIQQANEVGVTFSYESKDGEEGYPGNLHVTVTYLLSNNRLTIRYKALTDQSTIISLTNHSYFNLTGFETETVYDHYLEVNAENYTAKNENNTPSGEIAVVENTPLDFRLLRKIGEQLHELSEDMGYDQNFVLKNDGQKVAFAAHLCEETSGRSLKVYTNQPGMQVYSANWWDGSITGCQHKQYNKHGAIALETQAFPDAPNHPNFPNAILKSGEIYYKETILEFSNKES